MKKIKLNKKIIVYFLVVVLIAVATTAIILVYRKNNQKRQILRSSYQLNLSFDENDHKLKGKEKIDYVNNSENCFDYLYFHLYPNAFRQGSKASVVSDNNIEVAYPNGLSYGEISILKVYSEKESDLSFTIEGEDENILSVKLSQPLYPEERCYFTIEFETILPNINHRFGYGEDTINFGNFYPVACVYEEGKGFAKALYHSNGDPFYSECSNYEVEIECDKNFVIASSGVEISNLQDDTKQIAKYEAKNVRDFAFVLSKNFSQVSSEVDGVKVTYYGYEGDTNLENCLKVSVDVLATFNDMFGKYPYKTLSVVKSNFIHGGMEYPNIVLISDKIDDYKDLNYVIVHEIAHQWWYGLIGNDQYNDAWIDEGLAEFSTLLFFEKNAEYGEDYKTLINNALNSYLLFEDVYIKVAGSVDGRIDRAINEFETEPEYSQCTYTKSVLMLNSFRELIGKDKMIKTLKKMQEKYQYNLITPEQFIAEFEKYGGKETESFFRNWLDGKVILKKVG